MPFFDSKRNFKDLCFLFAGRLGIGLGQIVSMRIITEIVSPSQIGLFNYILAFGNILSSLLFQPVSFYVTKEFLVWTKTSSSKNQLLSLIKMLLLITAFSSFLFFIYWHLSSEKDKVDVVYFTFVPAIMLTGVLIGIGCGIVNLLRMKVEFVILNNLLIWFNLICTVLMVMFIAKKAEIMLLGQLVSQIIVSIIVFCLLGKILDKNSKDRQIDESSTINWREVWIFCWPVAIIQILFWSQSYGFRIPLKINAGMYNLGIFSVVFGITIALFAIFNDLFAQLYHPIFWKNVSDYGHRSSDLSKYMKNHWPYLILFTFWVIGISMHVLRVMATGRYSQFYFIIIMVAISELIRHSGAGLYNSTFAINRNKILIFPGICSFIICLGGTYYLGLAINPINAAIISLAASYLASMILLTISIRRHIDFEFPWLEAGVSCIFGCALTIILFSVNMLKLPSTLFNSLFILAGSSILFVLAAYSLSRILRKIISHNDSQEGFISA